MRRVFLGLALLTLAATPAAALTNDSLFAPSAAYTRHSLANSYGEMSSFGSDAGLAAGVAGVCGRIDTPRIQRFLASMRAFFDSVDGESGEAEQHGGPHGVRHGECDPDAHSILLIKSAAA